MITGKSVILRLDLNVPLNEGVITDSSRIKASLPTIKALLSLQPKKLIIISHLGRPKSDKEAQSLSPVVTELEQHLGRTILLAKTINEIHKTNQSLVMLENIRMFPGEMENSQALAQSIASCGDLFVMDAFATIHRAHASTNRIASLIPAIKGPLLDQEVVAINRVIANPSSPRVAIVGGAKISTKLGLITCLLKKIDTLIPGGGIANTLLAAKGYTLGKSLQEPSLIPQAKALLDEAKKQGTSILLPRDAIVSSSIESTMYETVAITEIPADKAIFDIGPHTLSLYQQHIATADSILWNGPVGVFEKQSYQKGTFTLAKYITSSSGFSLAGGGDTLSAINACHATGFDYLSTGGGAMLAYCENKAQPGLEYLAL